MPQKNFINRHPTSNIIMNSLGICIGASTIKAVALNEDKTVSNMWIMSHECNPRLTLKKLLGEIGLGNYSYVTLTGRKFKDLVNLPTITEPEASEHAFKDFLKAHQGNYNALVSLGSENFILYALDSQGSIISVQSGNKCASGTGEFFLQQIRRMNVGPDEAIRLARESEPYRVSGRCSVFCKSDCTHALNKGVPIGSVCAGLCSMMADKVLELLQSIEKKDIVVVGGVSKNSYVIEALNSRIENLVIPDSAGFFEALGAAAYALDNHVAHVGPLLFADEKSSFSVLPPLESARHLVQFMEHERSNAKFGDGCILGLDVGSTTTKAVLMRLSDKKIVASVYLRTNGDPVGASRECYRDILGHLKEVRVKITGLGVTGSGRHIAGLHAMTGGVINEIIAHARAAAFFDNEVDSIIEIGGQDAKYTYLVNGVPCDYAMNEACSAGTGSFLEEASKESLNLSYLEIEEVALRAKSPPNFNDQCAAFISSDVKNASHENIARDDIVAGLVYSICMNYNNRVRGSRKLGDKVFMQGGVCYNKAVPLAMAALLNRQIIVPPEPGLMGAFGVALEVESRIDSGLLEEEDFSLRELADRAVEYGISFTCPGTQEKCDRGCKINIVKVNGKSFPFGGICNKYYNALHHISVDTVALDLAELRQSIIFPPAEKSNDGEGIGSQKIQGQSKKKKPSVGISKSFFTNSLYPLYSGFFKGIGAKIMLSSDVDPDGVKKTCSSFCFPAEISHGIFMSLLAKNPDFIFLPQITALHVNGSTEGLSYEKHTTCVLAQSEPYFIRSAFREIGPQLLTPILNFNNGWHSMEKEFVKMGRELGAGASIAKKAYRQGVQMLKDANAKKKEAGLAALKRIESDPNSIGIILFGRSYNAFSDEANLGIPRKFASRGVHVIPYDFLSFNDEDAGENMCWATGQEIIKASHLVKRHPQLFGAYITNFSCGPDSFLVGYFRDIMKSKPSLTLELDSHSADAGITTRVEAFLDIIARYRKLSITDQKGNGFLPARLALEGKRFVYVSSDGEKRELKDPDVKIVFPSMSRTSSELVAAALNGMGYNSEAVPLPTFQTLMQGRANASCKECLPLIITTGSLLEYCKKRDPDELTVYFMPTADGNCRFSQYYIFMKKLVEKKSLKNVAFLTLSTKDNYSGLPLSLQLQILKSMIIADIMDDIQNALLVLPENKAEAKRLFEAEWQRIIKCFENGGKDISAVLERSASELSKIKLSARLEDARKALMIGEIFVRKDEFSSQEVIRRLARRGIVVKRSSILEWMYYVEFVVRQQKTSHLDIRKMAELYLKSAVERNYEKKFKRILARSGLYEYEEVDMDRIIRVGSHFINPALTGEAIVGVGNFFSQIGRHVQGVVSIGPFACLPTRVTESILSQESKTAGNNRISRLPNAEALRKYSTLPFISIESDGNPFPQIVEARIEAFALQVERMHKMMNIDSKHP
jgi:predicted CoA-substrate-specific enzyme activase